MRIGIYKTGDFNTVEDAKNHGALYEMSSNFTYDSTTGIADAIEVIEMCQRCYGGDPVQIVTKEDGESWKEYNHDVDL